MLSGSSLQALERARKIVITHGTFQVPKPKWSGAWSPSEPLVNTSEAGGVPDAGDVGEQDTSEVTPESSLGDALEGASSSGTPLSPHPALTYPGRERRPPRRLLCEM